MENLALELFSPFDKPTFSTTNQIVGFIYDHTTENARRNKDDIRKSVEYALKERMSLGGFVVIIRKKHQIVGVSVLNKTGLEGIMPDYILSHMAIDGEPGIESTREQLLLKKTLELCNGNVAFLIQANSPMVEACIEKGFEYKRLELVFSKAAGERVSEPEQVSQSA